MHGLARLQQVFVWTAINIIRREERPHDSLHMLFALNGLTEAPLLLCVKSSHLEHGATWITF